MEYLKRLWKDQQGNSVVMDMAFAPYTLWIFGIAFFLILLVGYAMWCNYVLAVATWNAAQAESRSPGIGQQIVMQTVQDSGITSVPTVTTNDNVGSQVEVSTTLHLPMPDAGVLSQFGAHLSLDLHHSYLAPRWWQ